MRKPVNRVALALWFVAAILIIGDLATAITNLISEAREAGVAIYGVGAMELSRVWPIVAHALISGGQLVGIGVLIEIVDQIRWNGFPSKELAVGAPIRDAIRRVRKWPEGN